MTQEGCFLLLYSWDFFFEKAPPNKHILLFSVYTTCLNKKHGISTSTQQPPNDCVNATYQVEPRICCQNLIFLVLQLIRQLIDKYRKNNSSRDGCRFRPCAFLYRVLAKELFSSQLDLKFCQSLKSRICYAHRGARKVLRNVSGGTKMGVCISRINYIETYHVNNLLQGESKLNFQRLGFISHRPLQGIVVKQEIIEQFSFMGSLQRFCNTQERGKLCEKPFLGLAAECRSFLRLQLSSGLSLFEPLYCSWQLLCDCEADDDGCMTPCVCM